jgi:hypothetical protein
MGFVKKNGKNTSWFYTWLSRQQFSLSIDILYFCDNALSWLFAFVLGRHHCKQDGVVVDAAADDDISKQLLFFGFLSVLTWRFMGENSDKDFLLQSESGLCIKV